MTDMPADQRRFEAAERMRLSRQRRRDGMRVIPFEIRDSEIENLVKLGILDSENRDNRWAIAGALGKALDRLPEGWWQRTVQLGLRLCGRNPSHAFLTDSRIGD